MGSREARRRLVQYLLEHLAERGMPLWLARAAEAICSDDTAATAVAMFGDFDRSVSRSSNPLRSSVEWAQTLGATVDLVEGTRAVIRAWSFEGRRLFVAHEHVICARRHTACGAASESTRVFCIRTAAAAPFAVALTKAPSFQKRASVPCEGGAT